MANVTVLAPAVCAVAAVIGLGLAPAAFADEDWGLNGTYIATSNGDWAKTNDSNHDEATVRSVWTITSTCTTKVDCVGHVESDLGWSADMRAISGHWILKRELPNWERCADGTAATGHQIYQFYGVNPQGFMDIDSTVLAGSDKTSGPSGACGINKALVIVMPFRLEKIE